jgi:hypothetical protein
MEIHTSQNIHRPYKNIHIGTSGYTYASHRMIQSEFKLKIKEK